MARGALKGLGACLAVALAAAVALLAGLWLALRPVDGAWTIASPVGPLDARSVWRLASHPLTLRLTAGRSWPTRFGAVRWAREGDHWRAVCTPCRVARPEWGREALGVSRAEFAFTHLPSGGLEGTVSLGDAPGAVSAKASFEVDTRGARLSLDARDVPLAGVYRLFAASLPEVARAHIEGVLSVRARLALPSRTLDVVPVVNGFRVDGLGTDALADAQPACGAVPPGGFGRWLPRAVLAAEDQRFTEHTGYDPAAIAAAWSVNQQQGGIRHGGSTLSQQLAKLLFTGDGRSPVRKLRELLYAVELDRTLGKARVLNLYLALAPWGEGRCGAAAAAWHHLGKAPAELTPLEAAWLASLLQNPDAALRALQRNGQVDVARVDWIMDQLRPLPPRRQRGSAAGWHPLR